MRTTSPTVRPAPSLPERPHAASSSCTVQIPSSSPVSSACWESSCRNDSIFICCGKGAVNQSLPKCPALVHESLPTGIELLFGVFAKGRVTKLTRFAVHQLPCLCSYVLASHDSYLVGYWMSDIWILLPARISLMTVWPTTKRGS